MFVPIIEELESLLREKGLNEKKKSDCYIVAPDLKNMGIEPMTCPIIIGTLPAYRQLLCTHKYIFAKCKKIRNKK